MTAEPRRKINLLGREFGLPRSRRLRIATGFMLVGGGCLGFLPVLGFWMLPLGLLVLSHEYRAMRRLRRRFAVWKARRTRPANGRVTRPEPKEEAE